MIIRSCRVFRVLGVKRSTQRIKGQKCSARELIEPKMTTKSANNDTKTTNIFWGRLLLSIYFVVFVSLFALFVVKQLLSSS
jgi:hypothetical protein